MNCPSCRRVLYSRQHATCGFCGAELPAELRLSATEISGLKAELAEIDLRHAAAREEAEAAEHEKRQREKDSDMSGLL